MHSLGLFTNGDISSAFLGIFIRSFSLDVDTRRKNRVWSLYSFQQPLFTPMGFDKSQESVSHNKEIEEGEMEKFGGGTVLVHLMSICHMAASPPCLQINFSHLSWKEHLSSFSSILKSHYFTPVKSTSILLKTQ